MPSGSNSWLRALRRSRDRELGRGVGGLVGLPELARDRRQVDDPALALGAHRRQRRLIQ